MDLEQLEFQQASLPNAKLLTVICIIISIMQFSNYLSAVFPLIEEYHISKN